MMAGQNKKKKYLMCQSPSKGIEEDIAGLGGDFTVNREEGAPH